MTSRPRTARIKVGKARLAEMIDAATVDCYNESELTAGWLTMIEHNLAVPFEAEVLGVQVTVERLFAFDHGSVGAHEI